MKKRILIVEDEALIADHLAACLESEGYIVQAIFDEAEAALAHLQLHRPDLILLDIQLAGALDGVDLAAAVLATSKVPIVYLTSNTDARTIARVKLTQPAGFIVKPFQPADLRPAIELALFSHERSATPRPQATAQQDDSFFIKDKHVLQRVYYKDILCAEAMDNYTRIHLADRKYMLSLTLKVVEEKLKEHGFFRIHRTWLVNVSRITCIRPTSVSIGEMEIPSSTTARAELLQYVETL